MRKLLLSRRVIVLIGFFGLSACSGGGPIDGPLEPMGQFRLGHNIVVADNAQLGPLSREADPDEWKAALTSAISDRFGRYEGERMIHIGASVDAYVLAVPGVPILFSPKSVLILGVNVWDDATQTKLTDQPHQITVLESLSGRTVVGSGLTQRKDIQMRNLSRNAAASIQRWLLTHPEWLGADDAASENVASDTVDPETDGVSDLVANNALEGAPETAPDGAAVLLPEETQVPEETQESVAEEAKTTN